MIFASPRPSVDVPEISLPAFVLRHAERLKEKPALVDGGTGRAISYGQAFSMIERMAAALAEIGFVPGDVLAIYAPNLPEYPVAVHAATMAGGAVTTANPMFSASDLNHQLKATQARFLITTEQLMERATAAVVGTSVVKILVFDGAQSATCSNTSSSSSPASSDAVLLSEMIKSTFLLPEIACDVKNDVAGLPFSSGTTGLPKGVMLTHHNMVANISQFLSIGVTQEHDVVLSIPPLFHIYGWTVMVNVVMAAGATGITMPQFQFDLFLQLLQDYKVTQTFVAPPVVQLLAKHPLIDKFDLSHLKTVISAGAPLAGDLADACAERLGCVVLQGYGMTEAGPITHFGYADAAMNRAGTIGHLYPDTFCKIVDVTTKKELDVDQEGEIWVKGPQIMKGYLNNPDETKRIIDDQGWLQTGDVGKVNSEGYLSVLDRIKELIKYKGFQVPPAELEGILLHHPAVADAAVIPSPNEESGEVPLALIVKKSPVTATELMEFVAERVTSYKKVREVEFVDEIPKTPSGKILRRVLIERQRQSVLDRNRGIRRLEERVTVERKGSLLLIGLDRPHQDNIFDQKMFLGLAKAITELEDDADLRCGVLFAHGSSFTAGMDLATALPLLAQGESLLPDGVVDPWGVSAGKRRRSKPLIAAITGRCWTLGIELCLTADIVIASEDARFCLAEASLGLIPFAGATLRLPMQAGWGNAMRYLLTGDEFGPQEAYRLGIVQEIVPADHCVERATDLAGRIAAQAPLAVQAILHSARLMTGPEFEITASTLLPAIIELIGTKDCKEGLRSFFEKRKAVFSGS